MSADKERVFAFLDEKLGFGAGCEITDYDSREAVLEYAIEEVGEDEGLTAMCGVGPLMADIEAWVAAFAAGERREEAAVEFCLSIKFDPLKLGYTFFRTPDAFKAAYPEPHQPPEHFPVLAKEVLVNKPAGAKQLAKNPCVLSYLYLRDVSVVG